MVSRSPLSSVSTDVAAKEKEVERPQDVVTGNRDNSFSALRGSVSGALSEAETYGVVGLGRGQALTLGDFDGDGDVDVVHLVPGDVIAFVPNQTAP